ncbi:MAG: sulfatase/phosphatase domain-containing protein, partial [Planctomycetota bacterium]
HGIPGFPRAKCNLYDLGAEVALTVRWPGRIEPGRVVDDFVNIMDLAPTFMEAAGLAPAESMSGRSLVPVLTSPESGQVDAERTFVVTGRERHFPTARQGSLPYPQRAIRTKDYLYIRNFEPDRWPAGDPNGLDDLDAEPPSYEELATNTGACYPDLDASPTKAWMIHHRKDEAVQQAFSLGFGKRPAEELYHLPSDPHYMTNVADRPEHGEAKRALSEQLMTVLVDNDDPRVTETPCRYEQHPYAGPLLKENPFT